jgi:hypothetical protein
MVIDHTVSPSRRSRKVKAAEFTIAPDRRLFAHARSIDFGLLSAQIVQIGRFP